MDTIAAWLDQLGLGQYAAAFEANAVNLVAVEKLSDTDLKKLGVRELDHRQRLFEAIDVLRRRGDTIPGPMPERRHLTVLFCDLVDSTPLSTQVDPEDMASLIVDYQRCCASAVARFGGFVARYVGDGILVYFGYPQALEESAERAIRAGLAVVQAVRKMKNAVKTDLQVRVGIATGLVVVGSSSGGETVERHAVVGETPNLAARLHAAAGPNNVVIAASTHRQVSSLFESVELEPISLKGFAVPIRAWRVLGERAFVGRFEARRAAGLTPYFGREAELDSLCECWRTAQAGAGQLVVIKGEAGIGKSRLVQELANRLPADDHYRIDYIGSPFHKNSPLSPVVAQLARSAGFARDDSPERKREKLDALLSAARVMPPTIAPVLAVLLSMPAGSQDPPVDPDARRRKRQIFDAIVNLITSLAVRKPVFLVFEDAQWFDPTTHELLKILIEKSATLSMLIIATLRPEFVPSWSMSAHAIELTLQRLDRGVATAMVEGAAKGRSALSSKLLGRIVERTDGNPLYIEELTNAVLESNLETATSGGDRSIAIPDTLQDLLIARLHHAAPLREVAQIGAAIGREFPQSLLEAVASSGISDVRRNLDRLVDSNLLHRGMAASETVYYFKHALIQDAAYETLLFKQRRIIHRRIAQVLETRFPETAEVQPELLAEHWERANVLETAIKYWNRAGQRAAGRSAASEADAHLSRAFRLVKQLPKGHGRVQFALDLSVQHGGVLRAKCGPAAIETGRAFARARRLCRLTGDKTLLVPALSGLYAYHFVRAENGRAAYTAKELLALAELRQDRICRMIGYRTIGMVLVHTGNLSAAREHLEQSLSLYDETKDGALAYLYGNDHAQTAAGFLAKALWLLGMPDSAAAHEAWATAHARKVNHLYSIVQSSMFRITVRLFARDWEAAALLAQETWDLAARHSLEFASTFSGFCLAACRSAQSVDRAEVEKMRAAAKAWGQLNYRPFFLGLIAEAQARAGDADGGLRELAEARSVVEATDERWVEPELYRLFGELKLLASNSSADEAEGAFRAAIALARRQAARSWELRSTVSLARLLRRCGRTPEAIELLAPIYKSFGEGFDTPDLREARNLLLML